MKFKKGEYLGMAVRCTGFLMPTKNYIRTSRDRQIADAYIRDEFGDYYTEEVIQECCLDKYWLVCFPFKGVISGLEKKNMKLVCKFDSDRDMFTCYKDDIREVYVVTDDENNTHYVLPEMVSKYLGFLNV